MVWNQDADPESLESKIEALETAIAKNRAAKGGLPDCPCWGNAPRLVDAELYASADLARVSASVEARWKTLEGAVRKHREDMAMTPECTCWSTPSAKADAELYAALEIRG
ncbi:MAG TPA: hypothetical protein VK914_03650 [bacterium]|nr:hypothetical protein [bacterium]